MAVAARVRAAVAAAAPCSKLALPLRRTLVRELVFDRSYAPGYARTQNSSQCYTVHRQWRGEHLTDINFRIPPPTPTTGLKCGDWPISVCGPLHSAQPRPYTCNSPQVPQKMALLPPAAHQWRTRAQGPGQTAAAAADCCAQA
jgi:hypothetical protein